GWEGDLVLIRDQQQVGEVDGGGIDSNPHVPRAECRRRELVDLDDLGRSVRPADRGAHLGSPAAPDRRALLYERCRPFHGVLAVEYDGTQLLQSLPRAPPL